MNALTCRPFFFMPCPQRAALVARSTGSDRSATGRTETQIPVSTPMAKPMHERLSIPAAWRRATRFVGGLLIGAALWAMVFAASAATQFAI